MMVEPMMPPPIRMGIMRVEMRKALVRTRSRYSRFAISQTLRIDLISYGFNKDLFESGFLYFEASDARSCDGFGEQRLCVCAIVKLDLGYAVVVLRSLDGWVIEERGVARENDLDMVDGVA